MTHNTRYSRMWIKGSDSFRLHCITISPSLDKDAAAKCCCPTTFFIICGLQYYMLSANRAMEPLTMAPFDSLSSAVIKVDNLVDLLLELDLLHTIT